MRSLWKSLTAIPATINTLTLTALVFLTTSPAFASSTSSAASAAMPWDTTMTTIQNDVTGPWAKGMVITAIAVTGGMAAFGEHGSTLKKGASIACGGSCALSAAQFATTLFGAVF